MSNILEFIIKFKDQMSTGLNSIGVNADKAFSRIDLKSKQVSTNVQGINDRLNALQRTRDLSLNLSDIRQANREMASLEKQRNRLTNTGSGAGGGALSVAKGMIGGNLVMQAFDMAKEGIGGIISAGANQEQQLIGLQTFLGKGGASSAFKNIQQDAAVTPFDTEGLLAANRALISSGISAEKARVDVLGLANAIAATGGSNDELKRMSGNLQQIKSAGIATGADIKQFAYAGIDISGIVKDLIGKELTDETVLNYETIAAALNKAAQEGGKYYGAMEQQSKSTLGMWSSFKDNIQIAAASLFVKMQPAINMLLTSGMEITDSLVSNMSRIGEFATPILAAFGRIITAIKPLVINIANFVAPIIAQIAQTVLSIFYRLEPIIIKVAKILNDVLAPVLRIIGWLFEKVWNIVSWIFDKVLTITDKILGVVGKVTSFIKTVSDGIGLTQSNPTINTVAKTTTLQQAPIPKSKIDFSLGTSFKMPVASGAATGTAAGTKVGGDVNSITGGGARNTYISLGKFQDNVTIYVNGVKEGVDQIQGMLEDALLRVLNGAGTAQ